MKKKLVVRFKFSIKENLKLALKSLGAHWDDLTDGWMVDPLKAPQIERILSQERFEHSKFEITLPTSYTDTPKRMNAMYGKYATLTKKLVNLENRLLEQVERYERTVPLPNGEHLPRAFHWFVQEPSNELPELQYQIELAFHNQFKELRRLRDEIEQLHKELLDMEKG